MNYWTLGSLMMMRNFSPFLIIRDVPLVCSDFPLQEFRDGQDSP